MDKAGLKYVTTEKGVTVEQIPPPVVEAEPEKPPWVPKVGDDTRDLRDPEKLGKRILAKVKARGKH